MLEVSFAIGRLDLKGKGKERPLRKAGQNGQLERESKRDNEVYST